MAMSTGVEISLDYAGKTCLVIDMDPFGEEQPSTGISRRDWGTPTPKRRLPNNIISEKCTCHDINGRAILLQTQLTMENIKRRSCVYFMRQLMICTGVWSQFFLAGQLVGAPTVFIPQMRRDKENVHLEPEMVSWLYSVFGFAAVPWVILMPIVSKFYGLRIPYIISYVDLIAAYLIFYFSTNPLQVLISEIIFGICYASCLTIGVIIVSEYSSPKYRGIFLTIKSASLFWGIWSANAIGTFFHWKSIVYPGFACFIYSGTFFFWPESPHWLASKGKFDECVTAFHWLFGDDETSKKNLEKLLNSQKKAHEKSKSCGLGNPLKTLMRRDFFVPSLLSVLLVTQYHFSGKFVCSIFAIDILKKITGSESTAYMGMLILDGITVFGMYLGCILSKILKRRCLYLTSSFIGVVFLFILSLYLYLLKLSLLEEQKILSIVLLTCFSISMSCGPMIMTTSIFAEIIPLKHKSVIIVITGLFFYIYAASLLKIAPFIFDKLGMHGSFLFYGITSGICTLLLYKYLPETKDKSLQDIEEEYFKDKDYLRDNEEINVSETHRLKYTP